MPSVTTPTQGVTTLGAIRLAAQQRADQENSQFLSTAEWNSNIAESYYELWGTLVKSFREKYAFATYTFSTTPNVEQYPLTDDFYRLLGIDWVQAPGSTLSNITLVPWDFNQRNARRSPFFPGIGYGSQCIEYNVVGFNTLWFRPPPPAAMIINVYYAPRATQPVDQLRVQFFHVAAADALTVSFMAGGAGTTFTCVASGATGNQFNVGLNDGNTTINAATVINQVLGGFANNLRCYASGTSLYFVPLMSTLPWALYFVSLSNANSMLVLPAINSALNVTLNATPLLSNLMDGVNGWEELLIVDAAIKAVIKRARDPSALLARKQEMMTRLITESKHRDTGFAPRQGGRRTQGRNGYGGGGGYV